MIVPFGVLAPIIVRSSRGKTSNWCRRDQGDGRFPDFFPEGIHEFRRREVRVARKEDSPAGGNPTAGSRFRIPAVLSSLPPRLQASLGQLGFACTQERRPSSETNSINSPRRRNSKSDCQECARDPLEFLTRQMENHGESPWCVRHAHWRVRLIGSVKSHRTSSGFRRGLIYEGAVRIHTCIESLAQ